MFTAVTVPVIVQTPVPLVKAAAPLVVRLPAVLGLRVKVAVIVSPVSTSLTTMSSKATLAPPSV